MEKFKNTKLHKKLKEEHKKKLEKRPLMYLSIVLFISFICSSITYLISPLYCYNICLYIFIAGAVSGALIFLTAYIAAHQSLHKTAQCLDMKHDARNRLETAFELSGASHPLKELQQQDTKEFYAEHKFSCWNILRLFFIAVILLFSGANMTILNTQQQRYKQVVIKTEKEKKAKEKTEKEKSPEKPEENPCQDNAGLKLILPEPEIRAKPLDEIEWAGAGQSTRGFKELTLSVYVNGKFIKDLAPDKTHSPKAGSLKIGGFIVLDEFDVQPFDLVSYHLTAYSQINGTPRQKIISTPQFIEIRPFREDAFFDKSNGQSGEMLDVLVRFLRLQIVLNKATFTAGIMRQQANKDNQETYGKFLRTVKKEQKSLNVEVGEFLSSKIARDFPAEAINNVEKACANINAACNELENLK